MKPQKGEYWIVEFRGKVTVGHCFSAGSTADLWEVFGRDILIDSTRTDFRAVRKIDIGAVLADPAPIEGDIVAKLRAGFWMREEAATVIEQLRALLDRASADNEQLRKALAEREPKQS